LGDHLGGNPGLELRGKLHPGATGRILDPLQEALALHGKGLLDLLVVGRERDRERPQIEELRQPNPAAIPHEKTDQVGLEFVP
jgi:hypothetical protein